MIELKDYTLLRLSCKYNLPVTVTSLQMIRIVFRFNCELQVVSHARQISQVC